MAYVSELGIFLNFLENRCLWIRIRYFDFFGGTVVMNVKKHPDRGGSGAVLIPIQHWL
jgi:hypothetical protein